MTTWRQYMEKRISGLEKDVPWFLHNKESCYDYLRENSFPTAEVLRRFDRPTEIDLEGLPSEFVLKPTQLSSAIGVMVLQANEVGWFDNMSGRTFSRDEIVEFQEAARQHGARESRIIVEEKISDAEISGIPRDFKAYCFRGRVALLLSIDRNSKPAKVAWFDGDLIPVQDGRVWCNPKYVREEVSGAPRGSWGLMRLASRLSSLLPTPFASIDMYLSNRGPLIGEVTLTPGGIYHGQHFVLSWEQQHRMGWLWEKAAEDLAM